MKFFGLFGGEGKLLFKVVVSKKEFGFGGGESGVAERRGCPTLGRKRR